MDYIVLIILLVILIALLVLSYFRKKKYNDQVQTMQESLKKGDKVVTYSGVFGTIVDIFTEDDVKQVILKTGRKDTVGYMQVDIKALYSAVAPEQKLTAGEKVKETKNEPQVKETEIKNIADNENKPAKTKTTKTKK